VIKRVGIIGQGFVGQALRRSFSQYYEVFTYDKFVAARSSHNSVSELCGDCDVVFVCVPTPMNEDGSCNTSVVEQVCSEAAEAGDNHTIVIKSTVPPGTTQYLNDKLDTTQIVFNPEFLTERFANQDF
jgi:UDPglucose 6-dehydrogenase